MTRELGSIENGVMFGRNGHMFLVEGSHDVLAFATGQRTPTVQSIATFEDNLGKRSGYCLDRAIPYMHVLHPDKHSVLIEDFPVACSISLGEVYTRAAKHAGSFLLYPNNDLRELGGEGFLHTDTHLSDRGILAVALLVVDRLTKGTLTSSGAHLHKDIKKVIEHTGDLGRKFTPGISHFETFIDKSWGAILTSNRLTSNDGIVDIWISPKARMKARAVLFGDSFGRDLCKFLSYFFTETVFLRTPYFHREMADLLAPDFLITQNVERYLSFVRPDDDRPNFFMFPYLRSDIPMSPADKRFGQIFSGFLSQKRRPYRDIAAEFDLLR